MIEIDKPERGEKEIAVEKLIRKSLTDTPSGGVTKYRICSKCGATIPQDTKKCTCGAEYASPVMARTESSGSETTPPSGPDALVDSGFSALKDSFDSAETELEKIAEEIAASVKGDIQKKETKFQQTAMTMQDTILRLQQEIIEMKEGFDKIAENIASEVREEIKKHEENRLHVVEDRIKDTLDQLHTDMKKEGASIKEEDTRVRTAKKELYDEVNKLMEHLKGNEMEIMDRERAIAMKEVELEKKKNELENIIAQKEIELQKRKNELETAIAQKELELKEKAASRSADELKKAEDTWKLEGDRLKAEIERMRRADSDWKKEQERLQSELGTLKKAADNWKKEESRLKAIVQKSAASPIPDSASADTKHEEIARMQSKILTAILKENPTVVVRVIKTLNISKEELKKLVS